MLNTGYNPIIRLEILSDLNLLSRNRYMYLYNTDRTAQYGFKVYLGSTLQTIAFAWTGDEEIAKNPPTTWPWNVTQKQVLKNK